MIRKHKLYVRPKKLYEKTRITEENKLVGRYGLKNKKEIWKTIAKVDYFRGRAKALANQPLEDQEVLFKKLRNIGLNVNSIADILDLKVEDLLKRRLPTIVHQKKLASTVKLARQLVSHKKVTIDGKIVSIPSYIVSVEEEKLIALKPAKQKANVEAKEVEAKTEEAQ